MIKYIGISGPIGSGKDTLAEGLDSLKSFLWPNQEVCIAGFADVIKEIIIGAFNAPREWVFGSQEDKQRIIPQTKCTVREALIIIGNAYSKVDPHYWTEIGFRVMEEYFNSYGHTGVGIFTDVRRPSQAEWIEHRGGCVIRLTRNPYPEQGGELEHLLDDYEFDAVIDNRNLTVEQTRALTVRYLLTSGVSNAKL